MSSPYKSLHRKITIILAVTAILPVLVLAVINYNEFSKGFANEMQEPMRVTLARSKNSLELFLAERSSTMSLIASTYSYAELASPETLQRIFHAMQREFSGFVDFGLINAQGLLVNYVGPHKELLGKDYSEQDWFHKVGFQNRFVSEVFRGFRLFPHVVIAVQHITEKNERWVIRATLDTTKFTKFLSFTGDSQSDMFLLSKNGVLQTDSNHYGKTLDKFPLPMPAPSYEVRIVESLDEQRNALLFAYSYLEGTDFVLAAIKRNIHPLRMWFMMRTDLLVLFCISVLVIYMVAAKSIGALITRLQRSDEKREQAMLQMEHSHKLSSIGRLAAGIAHEINNPLAIINEKAGLLSDLLEVEADFPRKEQFAGNLKAIGSTVARCRDITHRMLGFARRMDVKIEELDVNQIIKETLLFLEKEALHRSVAIELELLPDIPKIHCDRGQLQQVFLNVLSNALAASDKGGTTRIVTSLRDTGHIAVCVTDNGTGMDEETKKHIFEPFFTTKKEQGTGLGMFIIYGIIKRNNGEIEIDSELGRGTSITISLPVGKPSSGAGQ